MGDENFARILVTRTLATNNIKIIPDILVQGGTGQNGNDIETALVAQVLHQTAQRNLKPPVTKPSDEILSLKIKCQIR